MPCLLRELKALPDSGFLGVTAVMGRSFGTLASLVASSALASNEGAAIGAAFAEIMNYAAVYIGSLLLALTFVLISRRSNRKWYVAAVVGAAVMYVLLLVIIVYSNDFQLYKSFSGLYYGAIAINCLVPAIFYIRERRR